jgi:hypothetical protein
MKIDMVLLVFVIVTAIFAAPLAILRIMLNRIFDFLD